MEALRFKQNSKSCLTGRSLRVNWGLWVMVGVGWGWGSRESPGNCEDTECANRVGVRGLQVDTEQPEGVRAASRNTWDSSCGDLPSVDLTA